MLEKIKKIQGINHTDFDDTINMWIQAGKIDLIRIGIVDTYVNNPDSLIETAIITYVLSQLDVANAELYANSYALQKDTLRHIHEYYEAGETPTDPPTEPVTEPPTLPPTIPPTEPPTNPIEEEQDGV